MKLIGRKMVEAFSDINVRVVTLFLMLTALNVYVFIFVGNCSKDEGLFPWLITCIVVSMFTTAFITAIVELILFIIWDCSRD